MSKAEPDVQHDADGEIYVDFNTFALQLKAPVPPGDMIASAFGQEFGDQILRSSSGGVAFRSGGRRHYVSVRVQVLGGAPQEPTFDEAWDAVGEAQLTLPEGAALQFIDIDGTPSNLQVLLANGGVYTVRAHAAGWHDAAQRGDEAEFRHVERWLIQLWPTTCPR